MSTPVHALMTLVFRLEADRTEAICGLGRVIGAEAQLAAADARLEAASDALAAARARYPLHMVAATSRLDDDDYLLLQVAMFVRHGTERVRRVTAILGQPSDFIHLSHANQIFGIPGDANAAVQQPLLSKRVFSERLVILQANPDDPDDPVLQPGPAIAELMGWD